MHSAMAIVTEVITPEGAPVVRRARIWPRVVGAFVVGFVMCLLVAGGALLAHDASLDGRILTGVHVGAVDLSGLDQDEAAAALTLTFGSMADGRVVVRTTAGDAQIPFSDFSRRADIEAMVGEAMRTGRTGNLLQRAAAEVRTALSGVSLKPRLAFDEAALATELGAMVSALDRDPVDSTVTMNPTSIDTTPASPGRTFDADGAVEAATMAVGRLDAPADVVIEATGVEIPPAHRDVEALVAKAAAERMIGDIVVTSGKNRWTIKASTVRTWLSFQTTADGSPWPVAGDDAIGASLAKIAKAVKRAPVSAAFLKGRGGKVVGAIAATDGQQLDVGATTAAIAEVLASRAGGRPVAPIPVRLTKLVPSYSTADALRLAPQMVKLGSWKTWFPISERNYFGANIWLPAKIIDGTVLYPGQTFEWWRALGTVSAARGFGPGGFIAGDHTEPTGALGGGMCSSSTTLFNAALRAGLEMGVRSNHRYYISRYPLGLDATVSKTAGGSQTVTFSNDMRTPIVIRTFRYRSGGRGWVRYEIWGIPDGRTVSIGKPIVRNLRKATTQTVYVTTLAHGVRNQTEYPSDGMDVSVTRVVHDRRGNVIHRETYTSAYTLWNGRIEVGR
jgi:vancomycin resistance protein YoaR